MQAQQSAANRIVEAMRNDHAGLIPVGAGLYVNYLFVFVWQVDLSLYVNLGFDHISGQIVKTYQA